MKKTTLIGLIIIIILVILAIFQGSKISRLSDEVERQKANVETLVSKERTYKICDSINVAEIQALQLDKDQFEKLVLEKEKQIHSVYLFLRVLCGSCGMSLIFSSERRCRAKRE